MRLVRAVLLLVVGAAAALATTAVHQHWWGLLLGAAAAGCALVGLAPGWLTRLPFAVGWAGFVAWVLPPRPEGDYAIAGNTAGYTLLALAVVLFVYALATLPRRRTASRP